MATTPAVAVTVGLILIAGAIATATVVTPAAYRLRAELGGSVGASAWLLLLVVFFGLLIGEGGCPFD